MTKFKLNKIFLITLLISAQAVHAQELDPSILSKINEQQLSTLESSFQSRSFNDVNSLKNDAPIEESLVDNSESVLKDSEATEKFGYSFFNSTPSSIIAVGDLPLPNDYKISIKDNFTIILSGSKDSMFDVEVKLDGTILFPEIGSVYVAGISLADARSKLSNLVNQSFIGVNIDLSLNNLSAKKITIVGAVKTPGTYLVNPFSTITSALNYSGGISENGSLREIKLIKNDGRLFSFDLYDFLVYGNRAGDLSLDAGDTILVEGTDNFVEVSGSVMRPMIYEVKSSDTLEDLVNYALGFKRTSNKTKISISSFDKENLRMDQIETSDLSINVKNALNVTVFDYVTEKKTGILVKGAVKEAGYYDHEKFETLGDLVNALEFVNAYPFFSMLEQFDKKKLKQQTKFFSLNDSSTYSNLKLTANTKIYFISLDEFENFSSRFVLVDSNDEIESESNSESSLEDDNGNKEDQSELILANSSLDKNSSENNISEKEFKQRYDINLKTYQLMKDYELTINHDENIYKLPIYGNFMVDSIVDLVGLDLSDVPNFEATYISPIDNIVEVSDYRLMSFKANKFHNLSFKSSQNNLIKVFIYGAVEFPGEYTLSENSSLQDLYNLTGSFKSYANDNAIVLRRESIKQQQIKSIRRTKSELKSAIFATSMQSAEGSSNIDSSLMDSVNTEIDEDSLGRIAGIFAPNTSQSVKTVLENNDYIFVPKKSNTISVVGEVMNPNAFVFEDGITFREAVDLAGGYRDSADKRGAYIIKENGLIYKPGTNIFISSQDVFAGDTIVIPTKILAQNSTMDIVNSLTAILSQISFSAAAIDSLRKN